MKTKSGARCVLNAGRWAAYSLAGAATVVAANDAEAQILYSGTLNTPVGGSPVVFHTLHSNGHQGTVELGQFGHNNPEASHPNSGFAFMKMNGALNGKVAGFYAYSNLTLSRNAYPTKQAAGVAINGGLNFVNNPYSRGNLLAGTLVLGTQTQVYHAAQFRNQGNGQYLAFEFDKGAGEQFGWARLNMTTGTRQNLYTVVDYAYGAVGQAITVGETTLPVPTWTGNADDNFANPANWSTGTVPGATSGTANTDTAFFSQTFTNEPDTIDANRNLQDITFNMPSNQTVVLGAFGNPNPALLLTQGGTIQVASTALGAATINVPLILEGTPNVTTNSYTFANNTNLPGSVTLVINSNISPAAANSITTLNLAGISTANNFVDGVLSDGASGAKLALHVQGGNWLLQSGSTGDSYTGGTTIDNGATLRVSGSVSVMSQSMDVVNSGALFYSGGNQQVGKITGSGGSVTVNGGSLTAYQIRQSSLTIGAGNTVTLSPSGSGSATTPAAPNNINFSSSVGALTIAGTTNAWTGTLDIGNNGLVIQYGNSADPFATITNMVLSGYANGHWTGTGITSSMAKAAAALGSPTAALNIGLIDFIPNTGNFGSSIVFEGQTITTRAVLVRMTYMDDLVLAGDMAQANATSDALFFAANFGSGTTWGVGDVTHDGQIDTNDALLFAANYVVGLPSLDGTTGNAAALGGASAVPEPASLGLLAVARVAGVLAIRRRRRRKCRLSVGALATVELFVPDREGARLLPLAAYVDFEGSVA